MSLDLNGAIDSVTNALTNNSYAQTINHYVDQFSTGDFSLDFAGGPEVEATIAGLMIGVGVLLVLFGCRLFKATLFMLVMIATSGLVYYVGANNGTDTKIMLPVALVLGLFTGMLAIKLWKLALFCVGFAVGLVGFIVAKNLYPAIFTTQAIELTLLLVPSIIMGLISVCLERWWLLFATPILGAFLTVEGVDYFANLDVNVFQTLAGKAQCTSPECYGLWAGTAALAVVGMLIQWRFTAGFDHGSRTTVHKSERYVKQVDSV